MEIDELIQVIAAANFTDLNPENMVVAEDGIYFIDTEFKSFVGKIMWEKMNRFEPLISEDDKTYFRQKVQEKMDEPISIKEGNEYEKLNHILRILNKVAKTSMEDLSNDVAELERKISNLEYVGAKEVGISWFRPNEFSFNLREILT